MNEIDLIGAGMTALVVALMSMLCAIAWCWALDAWDAWADRRRRGSFPPKF